MKGEAPRPLTSVKRSLFRHPAVIAAGSAALAVLVGLNAAAFLLGVQAPWLLGAVLIADMVVVGAGILIAVREVLVTERRSEASEEQLGAIVDSAMDAIISVNAQQRIVLFNRAAEEVFGVRRADALGSALDRFIPARFRGAHRAHVE